VKLTLGVQTAKSDFMNRSLLSAVIVSSLLIASVGECRVGGGRSFGNRGSRGFSSPSGGGSPYRSYSAPRQQPQQAQPQQRPLFGSQPAGTGSTFLKSMGAGLAGGMLGSMLFRSFGGGQGYAGYGGGVGGGGIGILEILLLGGLLFFLIRMFMNRSQTSTQSSSAQNASSLMRQARPFGWGGDQDRNSDPIDAYKLEATPINSDQAMDLFFQIQGAWGNRDLSSVQSVLDSDAKTFLEQEVSRLKAARQINRLENIAVRNTEVVESWRDSDKEYSTVRFNANLLDFTIDEDTQKVVDGNKTSPIKFEEYWTFSKDSGSSNWKLAALQQN